MPSPYAVEPYSLDSFVGRLFRSCIRCPDCCLPRHAPYPGVLRCRPERSEGSAFRANSKEKADSSGKIRPRNDNLSVFPQTVQPLKHTFAVRAQALPPFACPSNQRIAVSVRLDIVRVGPCPLSETVKFIERQIMVPVTPYLVYPQGQALSTPASSTGHSLARDASGELSRPWAMSCKVFDDSSTSEGGGHVDKGCRRLR
jgi:hypothetical protein